MTNILQPLTFVNYASILYEFKQIQIVTKARRRGGKKKISINLTSCSFYTCISYFLSFFFPKVNQTNACNVRLFAPDSYCRNVVEWSSKTMKIFRGFHSIDIYISYKYIVVSSANAIVMNLEHSFSILFSG